jgi:hypothetical protein
MKDFGIAGTHDCWNLAAIVNVKLLESIQTFALIFSDLDSTLKEEYISMFVKKKLHL